MNRTFYGNLIFELGKEGRVGYSLPKNEFAGYDINGIPEGLKRGNDMMLPEVDELSVVRSIHWVHVQ